MSRYKERCNNCDVKLSEANTSCASLGDGYCHTCHNAFINAGVSTKTKPSTRFSFKPKKQMEHAIEFINENYNQHAAGIAEEKAALAAVDPENDDLSPFERIVARDKANEGPFKAVTGIPQLTDLQKVKMLNEPTETQKLVNRRIKDIDAEVNEIMEQHPTYQRLKAQLAKGLIKYGTPVTPDHYSVYGWFEHLQEESTDKMVYNELMLNKIEQAIRAMEYALGSLTLEAKDENIAAALEILLGSKEGNL